jgi:hypothetical protein
MAVDGVMTAGDRTNRAKPGGIAFDWRKRRRSTQRPKYGDKSFPCRLPRDALG